MRRIIFWVFIFTLAIVFPAFAQVKISELPVAVAMTSDDLMIMVDGATVTKQITFLNFAASIVSDAVYGAGWDTDATHAPSKNVLYDQLVLLAPIASPTFTGDVILPSTNADPAATAGALRHDSTVTNFTNGALRYYNGVAIKQLVDMTAATAEACTDTQVVAYNSTTDLWYCKTDSDTVATQASLHVDDILTALGIASEATHFGTFTGSTIADSSTAKAALQAIETSLELKATLASTALTWGDGIGPVVHTYSVTGTDPSMTFTNDFITMTANTMSISGKVGIGTEGPGSLLHVNSASGQAIATIQTGGSTGNNAALRLIGSGNADWYVGTNRTDLAGAIDSLMFYKGVGTSGTKMVIQDNGNVGIATTAPDAPLEVNSATGLGVRITYNDSNGSAANHADWTIGATGTTTLTATGTNPDIVLTPGGTGSVKFPPHAVQSVTCTENGSPSTLTITPTANLSRVDISLTVDDAEGCTITMAETSAVAETEVLITNISAANTATFTTSAGVLTLKYGSPLVLGSKQSLRLLYKGSEWLETGRTGGIGGVTFGGFTASRALYSDASGNIVAHATLTDTELGYLDGVTAPTGTGALMLADSPTLVDDISIGAAGVKLTGANGSLTILGLGDGQDEDIKIDLNTTANTITISSPASSATDISFSALNLATTGTIAGAIPSTTDNNGQTLSAAQQYGFMHWATGAGTTSLVTAVAGMSLCIYSTTAAAVVINPADADVITLNGTALAAGDSITSASGAGDFICLMSQSAGNWVTLGRSGTWTDTN